MISVLNHLLPSNGSKQVIYFLIPLFSVLYSCRTTTSVVKPEVVPPVVVDIPDPKEDSIVPPIIDIIEDSLETPVEVVKKEYKIALLLPFTLDNYNYHPIDIQSVEFSRATEMSVEFYQGFKMAVDELNNGPIKVGVFVIDTKNNPAHVRNTLNSLTFPKVDIMVGPVYNKNLRVAAKYCKANKIPLISPLSSSTTIANDNPFYYSANGTEQSHYEAIMQHIHQFYPDDTLRILHNNTSKELEVIQNLETINTIEFQDNPVIFNKIFVSTEANIDEFKLNFDSLKNHLVLIPSTQEIFTTYALSQLAQINNYYPSVVFGMPTWRNFTHINYDYLEWLQVHLSSSYWVNEHQIDVTNFKRNFNFNYSMPPSEYAYQGYDLANFIASFLSKEVNFKKEKERFFAFDETKIGLQTKYNFIPRATSDSTKVNYWDNQYIQILKFENYNFNKVD